MFFKKKKSLTLILVINVLILIITACNVKALRTNDETLSKRTNNDQPIVIRLAHVYASDHPFSKGVNKLAKEVERRSKGRLIIKISPEGQLGSEKDIADGIMNNIIDMAIIGPGELGKRFKPVLVFDAPYVFRDYEHMQKVVTGEVGKQLWDKMADETGIRVLSALYYGTRYVTTSRSPIYSPEDMKGLNLRTPNQPLSVKNAKAMGANPTPLALSEVYLALQQGGVDGQENPIATIATHKFNEVQKYIILTSHVVQVIPLNISEKKLNSIPEDLRKILVEVVQEISPSINQEIINIEKSTLEEFKKSGMIIVKPNVQKFKEATLPVIKEFEDEWGKGLYESIQAVQ